MHATMAAETRLINYRGSSRGQQATSGHLP